MADKTGDSNVFGKHGGFEKLLSYQVAELLEDITKRFVVRYVEPGSRTKDQMEQAARSGTRNIAEGSMFSATSKKLEMNLTNVARASLVELKKDYAAFLRQNRLPTWPLQDPLRQELIDRRFKTADEVAQWGPMYTGVPLNAAMLRSWATSAMCIAWWRSACWTGSW